MDAQLAAEILWESRLSDRRLDALPPQCVPRDLTEGYAIQRAMATLGGDRVHGWKIAATSEAGQRHIGVSEPVSGRLFERFTVEDGATIPGGPMHMRVVEVEFAFRMTRDLPGRATPYDRRDVVTAVDAMLLAIEVPDARFERFAEVGGAQIAADDAFASWFVLGQEVPGWRSLDLVTQKTSIQRNGKPAGTGSGANVLGDPLTALTWFVNHAAAHEGGVRAGDIVTTGTSTPPAALEPGDRFVAEFDGLGTVRVAFS